MLLLLLLFVVIIIIVIVVVVINLLGRGLHEGYNGRLLEFERFELKFKECLSNSAIKTKFEQHHSRGLEIVLELEELLNFESQQATQKK